MIVCQRCGKENQDHYKFCLGCGAEISPSEGDSVGMMKTMMADVGGTPAGGLPGVSNAPLGPPPGVGPFTPPRGSTPVGPPQGQPMGGYQSPPMAQGPMGQAPGGQPPMGQPMAQQPANQSGPTSYGRTCAQCQAAIPPNFKFCGVCGTPAVQAPAQAAPPPAVSAGITATMTLIRPDGSQGGQHSLHEGSNQLGRSHGDIFESDGYLSPVHAELVLSRDGVHTLRDLDSLNGVFVRMTEEEELQPGQIVRIGQELLRFDLIEPPEPHDDGTEVMGSPNPGYWGRITVIIGDNVTGAAYPLLGDSITMGREHGDINFPDDGYVSGMHARLVTRDNRVYLSDMGSSNGTFMKVASERKLSNNSYVLLGQQLFRLTLD